MTRVSIRLADSTDLDAIARVHAASVRSMCAASYRRDELERWIHTGPGLYERLLASSTVYVATLSQEVVGFAAVSIARREVRALYIDPAFAGRGLGARLLRRLELVARALGLRELRLAATLNAIRFYERCGWTRDPRAPAGSKVRCVPMRKRLQGPRALEIYALSNLSG